MAVSQHIENGELKRQIYEINHQKSTIKKINKKIVMCLNFCVQIFNYHFIFVIKEDKDSRETVTDPDKKMRIYQYKTSSTIIKKQNKL